MWVSAPIPLATRVTNCRGRISASLVISHAALQHRARANESSRSARCSVTAAKDPSSNRIFAKAKSPSLRSSRSGCRTPVSAGTSVVGPEMSISSPSRRDRPPVFQVVQTNARADARAGLDGTLPRSARRRIAHSVPSGARENSGCKVLHPAVSSHSADQAARSRPDSRSKLDQQVGERGVAPGVLVEVGPKTRP